MVLLAFRGGRSRGPGVGAVASVGARVRVGAGVFPGLVFGLDIDGRIGGGVGAAFLVVEGGGLRLLRVHFAEDVDRRDPDDSEGRQNRVGLVLALVGQCWGTGRIVATAETPSSDQIWILGS